MPAPVQVFAGTRAARNLRFGVLDGLEGLVARIARVLVAGMTVLALLTVGTAAPSSSHEQARSTLKVTPGTYVAGQKWTFRGSIGGK